MVRFRKKTISKGKTLADKFRQARLEQDIDLADVQSATQIQLKYLEALETGDYQSLPGEVYAKIWIKLYAEFLGLPAKEMVADYKVEKTISDRIKKSSEKLDEIRPGGDSILLRPRSIKFVAIALVIVAVLGYLIWQLNSIVRAPDILIFEPVNNFSTTESSVLIAGQTKAEAELRINNELVILDEDGSFSEVINLVVGLNNLEISAKKKHSRIRELIWNILRENIN